MRSSVRKLLLQDLTAVKLDSEHSTQSIRHPLRVSGSRRPECHPVKPSMPWYQHSRRCAPSDRCMRRQSSACVMRPITSECPEDSAVPCSRKMPVRSGTATGTCDQSPSGSCAANPAHTTQLAVSVVVDASGVVYRDCNRPFEHRLLSARQNDMSHRKEMATITKACDPSHYLHLHFGTQRGDDSAQKIFWRCELDRVPVQLDRCKTAPILRPPLLWELVGCQKVE